MRSIRFLMAALLLLSFSNMLFAQGTVLGSKQITFKKDVFEQDLIEKLAPQTKGYQFVLIKDGQVVSDKADGIARTPQDGGLIKMTNTTPVNIGSLFKFISGTLMLNLMEHPPEKMGSNYKQKSFDNRLDTPMWGELPKVWLDAIPGPESPSPTQRSITFRQLLQHRSGFDDQWNPSQKGGRDFLQFLKSGFLASQYDQTEYCNMNFVTVGYMVPLLERHNLNYDVDLSNNGRTPDEADQNARLMVGQKFDTILRQYVTNKITPAMNLSCDAKNTMKNTAAYGYASLGDNNGVISSAIETKGHCGGEGGYYMSARDFAKYVAYFGSTDTIVSKTVRDKMYNDSMANPNDRMVWAAASGSNWVNTNFKIPRVAWSNGGTDGTRTVLLRLPQNYYLVIFSNTRNDGAGQDANQLYSFGLAAFREGMDHNF